MNLKKRNPLPRRGMIRVLAPAGLFAALLMLAVKPARATQYPDTNRPPDVQTLMLAKSGSDIQLTCIDGTGPEFSFARNNLVTFGDPASLVLTIASVCPLTYPCREASK